MGEGERLQREALAMQRKRLGQEHAAVAMTLYTLAYTLYREGKNDEAESLCRASLRCEGSSWARTIQRNPALNCLAIILSARARSGAKRAARVLTLSRQQLGPSIQK